MSRYHVHAQVSCTAQDGCQSSHEIPTLCAPLATSARNAADIVACAVLMMRDSQSGIKVRAMVLDTQTGAVESFEIPIN
jgi:hypothetical protein